MPNVHAALSPSSAKRWCACPPSARLNQKHVELFGEQSSEYAEEGTQAHSLAEIKLRKELKQINAYRYKKERAALGDIPAEMDKATDYYVDLVMAELFAMKSRCSDANAFVEVRLSMEEWIPECFGTSDAVLVCNDLLEVIDFKYGKGVPVSAVENYQERIYALGAHEAFGVLFDYENVKCVICQPRIDNVSEETIALQDLLTWADTVVRAAADKAWKGIGEFKAGEHCRFCAVKAVCKANVLDSLTAIQNIYDSPDIISDQRINDILPFIDTAEQWIKDVRSYVNAKALGGQKWRGFKLVRGRKPNRKFTDEAEVKSILSEAGYPETDYLAEPKLKSLSDLEKFLNKKTFDALLGSHVTQGEASLVLVPESDKREEYTPDKFSDLGEFIE